MKKYYYNVLTGEIYQTTNKIKALRYFKQDALLYDYYYNKKFIIRYYLFK